MSRASNGSLDRFVPQARQDAQRIAYILKDNIREARMKREGVIDVREINNQVCLILPYDNGDRIFGSMHSNVNYTDTMGYRTGLVDVLVGLFNFKSEQSLRGYIKLSDNPISVTSGTQRRVMAEVPAPFPANGMLNVEVVNGKLPEAVDLTKLPLRVVEDDAGAKRIALVFDKADKPDRALAFGSLLATELEKALGITQPTKAAAASR